MSDTIKKEESTNTVNLTIQETKSTTDNTEKDNERFLNLCKYSDPSLFCPY